MNFSLNDSIILTNATRFSPNIEYADVSATIGTTEYLAPVIVIQFATLLAIILLFSFVFCSCEPCAGKSPTTEERRQILRENSRYPVQGSGNGLLKPDDSWTADGNTTIIRAYSDEKLPARGPVRIKIFTKGNKTHEIVRDETIDRITVV